MNNLEIKTREIIKKFNIRANKSLGQNFLIDERVLDSIVEAGGLTKDDLVIEVGPGLGSLTAKLCEKAGKVISIELDRRFINILDDVMDRFENFEVIQGDILKIDLKELLEKQRHQGRVKVIANLPYYITSPVIMKLLEDNLPIDSIVIMIQKEVADRIVASPGGKEYGALTLAVNFYGKPEIVREVPNFSFVPAPEVTSSVLRIKLYDNPGEGIKDKKMFFKVVKAAFSQRRKTLENSLKNSGILSQNKEEIANILRSIGVEPSRRAETLSMEEYVNLTNKLV